MVMLRSKLWIGCGLGLSLLIAAGCHDAVKPAVSPARNLASGSTEASAPPDATPDTATSPSPTRPGGVLPSFRMVDRDSGFDFRRNDDIQGQHRILEANGGGVALFDYDRDGLLDIFMTNGCRLPLKLNDRSSPSELFQNRGAVQFEKRSRPAQLLQFGYSCGCAVGDYDSDGFDDLYLTALGPDALWHNNGDGTFTNTTNQSGIHAPQWGSSAAFADLNGDGHLDLYVVNYLEESDESPKLCPNPASPDGLEQCPPAMFEGAPDLLFLSDGEGHLVDVTRDAGLGKFRGKGLGIVICDFDHDSRVEIYVANDGEANFLFVPEPLVGEGSGPRGAKFPLVKFTERALYSGCALSESGYAQAGMGVAAGDYDSNGMVDLFITHFYGDTNTLYANRGRLTFEDVTRSNILGVSSRSKLGFGTEFCDVDNDGWLDLIVANGHIDDRTWLTHNEPYRMQPQVFRNERHGNFIETSNWSGDYFHQQWLGRGLAVGDLDHDGKLDAVVSHQLGHSVVLHNITATSNRSMTFSLVGTNSNRNAYNARIELITPAEVEAGVAIIRHLHGGGSFQSASATEIHLGIGDKQPTGIRISWPSGLVETHSELTVGRWTLVEGAGPKMQN